MATATRPWTGAVFDPTAEVITIHGDIYGGAFRPQWVEVMNTGGAVLEIGGWATGFVPSMPALPPFEFSGPTEPEKIAEEEFEAPRFVPDVPLPQIEAMTRQGFEFAMHESWRNYQQMIRGIRPPEHWSLRWTVRGWQWARVGEEERRAALSPEHREDRDADWAVPIEDNTQAYYGWNDYVERGEFGFDPRPLRLDEWSARSILVGAARLGDRALGGVEFEGSTVRAALQALGALMEGVIEGPEGNTGMLEGWIRGLLDAKKDTPVRRGLVRGLSILMAGAIGSALSRDPDTGRWRYDPYAISGAGARVRDGKVYAEVADDGDGVDVKVAPIPWWDTDDWAQELDVEVDHPGVVPDSLVGDVVEGLLEEASDAAVEMVAEHATEVAADEGLTVEVSLPAAEAPRRSAAGVRDASRSIGRRYDTKSQSWIGPAGLSASTWIELRVRGLTRAEVIAAENTLGRDTKTRGNKAYLALVSLASRTFGTVGEIGDFGSVLLRSLREEGTGRRIKSWAEASRLRNEGRLEFNQDEFVVELLKEQMVDTVIGALSQGEKHALLKMFGEGSLLANMYGLPSTWARRFQSLTNTP